MSSEQATGEGKEKYADPADPTCKYCGGLAERIVPEGTPFWRCDQHGKLNVSEVLNIEVGVIRE